MMNNFAVYRLMARVLFVLLCFAAIHSSLGEQRNLTTNIRLRRGLIGEMLYIGGVPPQDSILRMDTSRKNYYYSSEHPSCTVTNIGKGTLVFKLLYGTVFKWVYSPAIAKIVLSPGEKGTMHATGNFAATTLEIINYEPVRGIFYAHRGNVPQGLNQPPQTQSFFGFDTAITKIFTIFVNVQLVGNAYNRNFGAGVAAEMLYEVIFPPAALDPWNEIKKKVEEMVNSGILVTINAILENDIKPQKAKIQNMVSLINNSLVHDIYMSHVHELVGYETKFYFSSSGISNVHVNMHILPLYVRTVNMKLGLYTFGITYQKELHLSQDEVDLIKKYRENLVKDAIAHVGRVKKERLENDYNLMDPHYFYDILMRVRTQAAVHGEEYYSYWRYVVDPKNNPKINNTIMSYSDFFGISTPNLYKQAMVNLGEEPLTPRIVQVSSDEVKRLQLISAQIQYHGSSRSYDIICGIVLKFENDVEHQLGAIGYKYGTLDLKDDNKIESLEVKGNIETIDCLNFIMTDKSSQQFGHNCNRHRTTFHLKEHYIASLYIAKDNGRTDGRVVNIAVSYQRLNDFYDTELTPQPKEE